MNRLLKIGVWGLLLSVIISVALHFVGVLDLKVTLPFTFPWVVILFIYFTNRRKK